MPAHGTGVERTTPVLAAPFDRLRAVPSEAEGRGSGHRSRDLPLDTHEGRVTACLIAQVSARVVAHHRPSEAARPQRRRLVQYDQLNAGLDEFSRRARDAANHSIAGRADRQFHLHRLERHQHISFGHSVAGLDLHRGYRGRHW